MKTIAIIAKREFTAYFISPIAYVTLVTFLVVASWFFFRGFFLIGQADLRSLMSLMPWMFLFFVPAIAMGKWAEERRGGTLEILLTLPIRDRELVLGKFFAAWGLIALAVLFTLPLAATVALIGPLDWGPVIGGYVGTLLMGGAFLAMSLVVSCLTHNQIIAFIIGVMICFFFMVIGTPLVVGGKGGVISSILTAASVDFHFESIGRGVIDLRDVFYFVSLIGFFLFVNLKVLTARSAFVMVLSAAIGLVVLNTLVSRVHLRCDLTEGREYTLAAATRHVLQDLDDVATIRVYFSTDLPPQLLALRRSVDDVLAEFKATAGKNVQIEYVDPGASQLDEQKAMLLGIPPVQLNVIESDRREVAKVYLGLAILYRDGQEVLPVVERANNLEYDVTQALLKLSQEKKPALGWLLLAEPKPDAANAGDGYDTIRHELAKRFEIVDVEKEKLETIDLKHFTTLVSLGNGALDADLLSAIDQFVLSGGRLIALADRWRILPGLTAEKIDAGITPLLTRYGVTVEEGLILDQANAMAAFTGGVVTYHLPYPYWPEVGEGGFAATVPMVAGLKSLILPWTSALTVATETPEQKVTVLASTSPYGVVTSGSEPPALGPDAARRLVASPGAGIKPLVALATSGARAQVLVVGNSRFIQDGFLQMFPTNALFFENAVDQLAWGGELIGIRSRASLDRPIAVLSDHMRLLLRTANMIFAPFLMLIVGGIVALVRRSRHRALRLAYQQ